MSLICRYTDVILAMSYSTPEYSWMHFVGFFFFGFIITKYLNQVRKLNIISPNATQCQRFQSNCQLKQKY